MKRIILSYITLLLILLPVAFIFGCQQKAPSSTPTSPAPTLAPTPSEPAPSQEPESYIASRTYTNTEHGFSCQYPADWDVQEGLLRAIVVFAGPLLKKTGGMVNINVGNQELPEYPEVTLEDFVTLTEMQIKKAADNYQRLDEDDATISGVPAKFIIYTFNMNSITFKGTQLYIIKDNVVYVITYTATPDTYDDYASCFDLVKNTFKLD